MGISNPKNAVIVTGGASGIGRATALALAEVGREVAIWDLDQAKCDAVAEEALAAGAPVALAQAVDLRNSEEIKTAAIKAREGLGNIGGIAQVAGVVKYEGYEQVSKQVWDLHMDVNAYAFLDMIQVFTEDLVNAENGSVVVVSSVGAYYGGTVNPAYVASKGAVSSLMRALALSLAPKGVRVNSVCPGMTLTTMFKSGFEMAGVTEESMKTWAPLGRIADPSEMGTVIRFLLSEDASYIVGQNIIVDGGMTVQ